MSFTYSSPPDDISFFTKDVEILHHFKEYMLEDIKTCLDDTGDTLDLKCCTFEDKRDFRRAFPHGKQMIREFLKGGNKRTDPTDEKKNLYFVGFFGLMKENVGQDVMKKIWGIDNLLIQELTNHPHMLFYGSCQIKAGGDYFNLVLFKSEEAIGQWRKAKPHEMALGVSSEYYQKVHIHMGEMVEGLLDNVYKLYRTTFVNYSASDPDRFTRDWTKKEDNTIVVKI